MSEETELPPLHPQRIQAAVEWLQDEDYGSRVEKHTLETCLATLKIMQRSQVAIGITTDVADLGMSVRKLIGAAAQVIKRKR